MRRRAIVMACPAAVFVGACASVRTGSDPETVKAIAPTGTLRAGFLAGPIYATRDASSGRFRGVAVDLAEAMARELGVPLEAMPQPSVPALLAGAKAGDFDVVMMGIAPDRAAIVDFSAPYMEVETGVLARPGVPAAGLGDLDRPGLRIGVLEKSGADGALSRQLTRAEIVRVPSLDPLFAQLAAGRLEMAAATKSRLFDEASKLPGSRVLDGRLLVEPIAMGVPKGRDPAAARYVDGFVRDAKARGLVAGTIDRAKLRGVAVSGQP